MVRIAKLHALFLIAAARVALAGPAEDDCTCITARTGQFCGYRASEGKYLEGSCDPQSIYVCSGEEDSSAGQGRP